jgi:hypothetical protein
MVKRFDDGGDSPAGGFVISDFDLTVEGGSTREIPGLITRMAVSGDPK